MSFEKVGLIEPFPLELEYKKHQDISPGDISKLREWLKTQPHLPVEHITDIELVLFYHCCERSAEVSKQVIDLHYTLKTLFTGLFKDRCYDPKIDNTLNTIQYAVLPTPTVQGYRAVYCRLLDPDPRNFIFSDVIRAFMMVFDLWQRAEGSWPGLVILIDMDQAKMAHVTRLDPMTLRQTLYFLQECMLVKLKEVHFLNAPSFMDALMMLLKPFMKKALLDIIRIHEIGSETIYKYVPKAAFPKEQGGEYKGNSTIRDELIKRFKDNASYFKEENIKRVNEAARPGGKAATVEDLFGIQGSFKKLDID